MSHCSEDFEARASHRRSEDLEQFDAGGLFFVSFAQVREPSCEFGEGHSLGHFKGDVRRRRTLLSPVLRSGLK